MENYYSLTDEKIIQAKQRAQKLCVEYNEKVNQKKFFMMKHCLMHCSKKSAEIPTLNQISAAFWVQRSNLAMRCF